MEMKFKKYISILLALVMVFSFTATGFAASEMEAVPVEEQIVVQEEAPVVEAAAVVEDAPQVAQQGRPATPGYIYGTVDITDTEDALPVGVAKTALGAVPNGTVVTVREAGGTPTGLTGTVTTDGTVKEFAIDGSSLTDGDDYYVEIANVGILDNNVNTFTFSYNDDSATATTFEFDDTDVNDANIGLAVDMTDGTPDFEDVIIDADGNPVPDDMEVSVYETGSPTASDVPVASTATTGGTGDVDTSAVGPIKQGYYYGVFPGGPSSNGLDYDLSKTPSGGFAVGRSVATPYDLDIAPMDYTATEYTAVTVYADGLPNGTPAGAFSYRVYNISGATPVPVGPWQTSAAFAGGVSETTWDIPFVGLLADPDDYEIRVTSTTYGDTVITGAGIYFNTYNYAEMYGNFTAGTATGIKVQVLDGKNGDRPLAGYTVNFRTNPSTPLTSDTAVTDANGFVTVKTAAPVTATDIDIYFWGDPQPIGSPAVNYLGTDDESMTLVPSQVIGGLLTVYPEPAASDFLIKAISPVTIAQTAPTGTPLFSTVVNMSSAYTDTVAEYLEYVWQYSSDGGANWTDIPNSGNYWLAGIDIEYLLPIDLPAAPGSPYAGIFESGNLFRLKVWDEYGSFNPSTGLPLVSQTSNFAQLTKVAGYSIAGYVTDGRALYDGREVKLVKDYNTNNEVVVARSTTGVAPNPYGYFGFTNVINGSYTLVIDDFAVGGAQYYGVAQPVTVSGSNLTNVELKVTPKGVVEYTQMPANDTKPVGGTASFSATVRNVSGITPAPTLTYQWMVSKDKGATWAPLTGIGAAGPATSGAAFTYNTTAVTADMHQWMYKAVVYSSAAPSVEFASDPAVLRVAAYQAPVFTVQPVSVATAKGRQVVFTATAKGTTPLNISWMVKKTAEGAWENLSGNYSFVTVDDNGARKGTLTIAAGQVDSTWNGWQFKAIAANRDPAASADTTVDSSTATLTVAAPVAASIVTQPKNPTDVAVGRKADFKVEVAGTGPFVYDWQESFDNGNSWTTIPYPATPNTYAKTSEFTMTRNATDAMKNGVYQVRVRVASYNDDAMSAVSYIYSNPASINVTAFVNVSVGTLADVTAAIGQTAKFTITAQGSAPFYYLWQRQMKGSSIWEDLSPLYVKDASSYSIASVSSLVDGAKYRVWVAQSEFGQNRVLSNQATLKVIPFVFPAITKQPANAEAPVGGTASFTVEATGTGLQYKWYVSSDEGATWTLVDGAISATYTVENITEDMDGNLYKVVVYNSDGDEVTSDNAMLIVGELADGIEITSDVPSTGDKDGVIIYNGWTSKADSKIAPGSKFYANPDPEGTDFPQGSELQWTTSDETVISIDVQPDGAANVTAVGRGKAWLYAKLVDADGNVIPGFEAQQKVSVKQLVTDFIMFSDLDQYKDNPKTVKVGGVIGAWFGYVPEQDPTNPRSGVSKTGVTRDVRSSTGAAELVKGSDGNWKIKGLKPGYAIFEVTATDGSNVTRSVRVQVVK